MGINPLATPVQPTTTVQPGAGTQATERSGWLFTGVSQVVLLVWALLVIFPFLWMVMTSFKTDPEIIFSPWTLPAALQWENFSRAWNAEWRWSRRT